jgi:hypothetical protein
LKRKYKKEKGKEIVVQVQQANGCCGFRPRFKLPRHTHWPLRPLRAVGLAGDGQRCWFCFFLCRFTRSLSFSFPATVFARFLLLCASSHAVSFDFDSVTVDGRKIGAEAILDLINK